MREAHNRSALRKVRKQKRAATRVKKRGRFACKPATGARFSTAKCRSRESDMRMVLVLLTSLRSFSSFWHGIARKRSLLVLRASVDIKSTEKSATMSRVFCTFFPQKGTQKSPADACAYSVPSNVRNGRLFAGLQANRPRFLPLLAGTSFRGSGIGPGPFAAVLSFRPGIEANTRTKDVRPWSRVRMFAQNRTENRTESEPKLPAAMRIPVLNRARVSSTPSRRVP